jgi:DNA-binding Lrp family transcriptional regulator
MTLDQIDRRILRYLAVQGRATVQHVADAAGLSQSACSRRIQALETRGIIAGYGARFGAAALGRPVTVLVNISLSSQAESLLERFEAAVAEIDGVISCHLVSGEYDYHLRILCRDLGDYERLHREHLGQLPGVTRINSTFTLREVPTRGEAAALFGSTGGK